MSSINTNMSSIYSQANLNRTQIAVKDSLTKLSSGYRINQASDDAAGLAISEKMRAQIRGLKQANRNVQDGVSLIQTAEGALNESHSILQRMRELSDQSANGTNTSDDRKAIQDEIDQLRLELDRIGNSTEFNTQKILNGNLTGPAGMSVGQNSTASSVIAKQTSGTLSGALAVVADPATDYVQETISIDGVDITIHWESLTVEEKNILSRATNDTPSAMRAAELIEQKINSAIDESGVNVPHIASYYIDPDLVLESGTKGVKSSIVSTSGVIDTMTTGTSTSGESNYNGGTILGGQTADLRLNGVLVEMTLPAVAQGVDMTTVASDLQTQINAAITVANNQTGRVDGEEGYFKPVIVKPSNDGRIEIISESGSIEFADQPGKDIIEQLGLSQAQSNASGTGGMIFQVGANKGQIIVLGIKDMRSTALGVSSLDVSTQSGASNALDKLDKAIKLVSSERSNLGAMQNRFEHSIANLDTSVNNMIVAESNIRDVDMASEMSSFTKSNILAQAGASMLAQANQAPQMILKLLG